ncbi:MAG: hypothetical protein ACSLFP_10505 [Acidimicrobiales bacterium]
MTQIDPHHARKRAGRYHADTLHEMLLADYVAGRPLGGPMERGTLFTIEACEKIAAYRRTTVEDYFTALLAEGAAKTGRTVVSLA